MIALWKGKKLSNKTIAKKLGRAASTIDREIRNNSFEGRYYVSIHAQVRALKGKSLAGRKHPLNNKEVFRWVIAD